MLRSIAGHRAPDLPSRRGCGLGTRLEKLREVASQIIVMKGLIMFT